jgi:hypothetical protein
MNMVEESKSVPELSRQARSLILLTRGGGLN